MITELPLLVESSWFVSPLWSGLMKRGPFTCTASLSVSLPEVLRTHSPGAHREWKSQSECVTSEVLQAGGTVFVAEKRVVRCGVAVWPSGFHTLPTLKLGEDHSKI